MLLVNELLFAYFSIGPSSKFNLWDYCYDDIQQRIPYSHHCPSWYFASKLDFSEIDPPRQGGGPKAACCLILMRQACPFGGG